VGSHVVEELCELGHDVVILDRAVRPDHLDASVTYLRGDVRDTQTWIEALRGVDAVSHQAAKVGLGVRAADVSAYVADNDVGTAAGLWAMDAVGFHGRLVLASSMVVYGEGAYTCARHGTVPAAPRRRDDLAAGRFDPPCPVCGGPLDAREVTEDAPADPRNVYAATKLHQEHLCRAVGAHLGVTVAALRYHNVYGPRMPRDTPYAGVASIFASELHAGRAPRVFEDGGQRRDFIHVTDVAHANVLALTRLEPAEGAFNVCSGTPRTVLDLAESLSRALGGPDPVVTGDWRVGDVRHVFASPSRAREVLEFEATVPFDRGLAAFALEATAT
jgi:dTDP-L-rhamnose 4-epimerase